MKDFITQIISDDFFPKVSLEDRKSNLVLYSWIFPLLVFIIYMDLTSHGVKLSWHFILVKTLLLLTVVFAFIFTYYKKAINVWPVVMAFYMLTYSVYGVFYINFDYCYSFLELYFAISIFFKFSKKTYFLLMLWGGILNFITLKYMPEPDFIKPGMSFKPAMYLMTFIIYYLSILLFYFVTKKRDEVAALQEKFALIGKQSSYVFHEIKKPISRLMSTEVNANNDIQQISNILLQIELMLNNPDVFKRSFNHFDLKNVFLRLSKEFEDYFSMYKIEYFYPERGVTVLGNEGLLYQVFKNLIMNAIEAIKDQRGPDDTNTIKIEYISEKNNTKTLIKFSNTGSTIPKSASETIFNPFYSTKSSVSNNGLGLSFCKNIIEGHEGSIEVQCEKDGPAFFIKI